MARKGRAGAALAIAALGSFFAGTVSTFLVAIFAPPLTEIALKFGAAEYFSLMVVGLVSSIALAHGSVVKALAMVVLGLLFGLVGTDIYTGTPRFVLGIRQYSDGLNFVGVAVGLFGIAEILRNLENEKTRELVMAKVTGLMPTRDDFRQMMAPIIRGTVIGSALGILPGGGAILASFASYTVEKRVSARPEEFGQGAVAGVAGPESANNAGAQTSFIPMLTLGIPANPVMALMIGAMIIQGIVPGPNVATEQPALFWGIIASMWIGNLMLVIRSEFGQGAVAGVAGPESANNAGAQTSFIPMLTLGIPANPVMALMIGAMIIQGIVPGPNVATEQPALFWGIIASMWIGNLMLVI